MEIGSSGIIIDSYEIYEVLYKGVPIYIGSGKEGIRHLHVKSR